MPDFLQNFMKTFEQKVVIPGLLNCKLGKLEEVSTQDGKLAKTNFGKTIGILLPYEGKDFIAINYYGHIKKSSTFYYTSRKAKIGTVRVVHFASLRIEYIAKATKELELIAGFAKFKEEILKIRGFKQ